MPLYSTGANGLPVATSTWPSVQRMRSAGVASTREVGLESGKMMGREQCLCMVLTTSSVNRPGWPETPIRMSGRPCSITSSREMLSPTGHSLIRSSGWESLRWKSSWLGILSVMRPKRSTMNTRPRASASFSPSAFICATICSAMPQPALPAPRKATRFSESLAPEALQAAIRLPKVTAAVPWMSSLKQHSSSL
ncbi:hypothetical protein D3C79_683260 [compost metagenome]